MSHTIVQEYQKKFKKSKVPVLRSGMTVKITQKFLEGKKERQQLFQGIIIKTHEKTSMNATFTVRKIVDGIGVEKIFSIHSPTIEVEIVRSSKVRRSKLYYMRTRSGKSARLKEKDMEFKELLLDTGKKIDVEDTLEEAVEHAKKVEEAAAAAPHKEEKEEVMETPAEETKAEMPEEVAETPAAEEAATEEVAAEEPAPMEEATTEESKEEEKA